MNIAVLLGNLASEVELRNTNSGKSVASFLLAVDRPGKDAGADFIRIVTWNGSAEACANYLRKGSRVNVEGRIVTRTYERDGSTVYVTEVSARSVTFLSGAKVEAQGVQGESVTASTPPPADDDIPF